MTNCVMISRVFARDKSPFSQLQVFCHSTSDAQPTCTHSALVLFRARPSELPLHTCFPWPRQKPSLIPFLPPLHLAVASHLRSASGTLVRAPLILIPSLLPSPARLPSQQSSLASPPLFCSPAVTFLLVMCNSC